MRMRRVCGRGAVGRMELLATVLVVAAVLAVSIPALSHARGQGKTAVCMANLCVLGRAFFNYAADNDDNLVGSGTLWWNAWQDQRRPAWSSSAGRVLVKNFVAFPQDENHNFRNICLEDKIRGLQQGGLWPYVEDHRPYHCPQDTRHLSPPKTFFLPDEIGGYRTYSLGCVINGYGIGDGWATGEYYAMVTRMDEFHTPGKKFTFLEEQDGQGYNINTWGIYLNDASRWNGDPLSCLHDAGGMMGYADGHAERRRWVDETTIYIFQNQLKVSNRLYGPDEGEDLGWFVRRYIPGEIRPELAAIMPEYK